MLTALTLDLLLDEVCDMVLVICTPLLEDPEVDNVELLEAPRLVDEELPVTAPAVEELKAAEELEEEIIDRDLEAEYAERELDADVVSSVDKELGIGKVVIETAAGLTEVDSGLTRDPLCVVVIELSVDGPPPGLKLEDEVVIAPASDEDGLSVTVKRREIVEVRRVVVLEVVGWPLLVK